MNLKRITDVIKSKQAGDTTKMYDRQEFIDNINKITRGEMKPANKTVNPTYKTTQGTKKYVVKDRNGNDIEMSKEEFESFVKRRGGKIN